MTLSDIYVHCNNADEYTKFRVHTWHTEGRYTSVAKPKTFENLNPGMEIENFGICRNGIVDVYTAI